MNDDMDEEEKKMYKYVYRSLNRKVDADTTQIRFDATSRIHEGGENLNFCCRFIGMYVVHVPRTG